LLSAKTKHFAQCECGVHDSARDLSKPTYLSDDPHISPQDYRACLLRPPATRTREPRAEKSPKFVYSFALFALIYVRLAQVCLFVLLSWLLPSKARGVHLARWGEKATQALRSQLSKDSWISRKDGDPRKTRRRHSRGSYFKRLYGTIRYDTGRYGTVRHGTVRHGTVGHGTVRYGTWYSWCSMVWCGVMLCGLVWSGLVWYGIAWYRMCVCTNYCTSRHPPGPTRFPRRHGLAITN